LSNLICNLPNTKVPVKTDVTLIQQVYLEGSGYKVWLLLVKRSGIEHLIRVNQSGNLYYDLVASGPIARKMIINLTRSIVQGGDSEVPALTQKQSPIPNAIFYKVTQGKFAVEFPDSEECETILERDFLKSLKVSLDEWVLDGSGQDKILPVMHHPYWPTFKSMMEQNLQTTTLYRGIYGDNAVDAGEALRVWRMSSWTTDLKMAKDFAIYGYMGDLVFSAATGYMQKVRRGLPWAVYRIVVDPSDILLAPVMIEGFIDPNILIRYLGSQSEYVIWSSSNQVNGKIVSKTRNRISVKNNIRNI
jgi:hypothetical protein